MDDERFTFVFDRDLLWFGGENDWLTGRLSGCWISGTGLDGDRRSLDLDGDLRLAGGEDSIAGERKFSVTIGGLDFDRLVLILDRDFLFATGDVGCLGGG